MENNEETTKASIKFIQTLNFEDEILDLYRKIREKLKQEQYTEDELESVGNFSKELMGLRYEIGKKISNMTSTVKKYGLDDKPISEYLENKFKQINKEIPLD